MMRSIGFPLCWLGWLLVIDDWFLSWLGYRRLSVHDVLIVFYCLITYTVRYYAHFCMFAVSVLN